MGIQVEPQIEQKAKAISIAPKEQREPIKELAPITELAAQSDEPRDIPLDRLRLTFQTYKENEEDKEISQPQPKANQRQVPLDRRKTWPIERGMAKKPKREMNIQD